MPPKKRYRPRAKKLKPQPRVICDDCDGNGVVWSETSLVQWEEQTPWFDRVGMSPQPPDSWRDRLCQRCQGAGYLNLKDGGPLLERLTNSGIRRVRQTGIRSPG